MKIDFSRQLKTLEGQPLKDGDRIITLEWAATTALLSGDGPAASPVSSATGEEKLSRWKLAQRIHGATDPVEMTVEEVSLIKKLIAPNFAVIVVGQAFELLESN